MKKVLSLILSLLLIVTTLPVAGAGIASASQTVTAPESLKILCIGNSFACDTIEHVANIALNLGVQEVKLGALYIGGCSITKHYENATNDNAVYEYFVNTGSGWSVTYGHAILATIESEEWDYISIQHGTGDGSRYAEEASYTDLPALVQYVKEHAGANTKIAFNMTWVGETGSHEELISVYNNDQLSYYNAIAALTRDLVVPTEGIDIVSPTGTAVQNARTSEIGILTRDNYHLSFMTGRYIAGLTFFKALTGVDISGITWAPSNMTAYMKAVAVESANNANATPFAVTASAVTPPAFTWPDGVTYGDAATPENPYYAHAAKSAPIVAQKVNLLKYFEYTGSNPPSISQTVETYSPLYATIDLNETPYLYYSFVIPEGSDFTFSLYSNTTYAPWLTFLDVTTGNASLNSGAENWDAAFADNRAQYATVSQTGCIDMREYLTGEELTWIINQMKFYKPKGDSVIVSYFFFGSEASDVSICQDGDSLLPTDSSQLSQVDGVVDYTLGSDGALTIARSAESEIAWPSIDVACNQAIDLKQTPYLHLQMNTAGGYANGRLYYTDTAGTSGSVQLSKLVNGDATDFTTDTDVYVDLSAYLGSTDTIIVSNYTLSVYGVAGASLTWTGLDVVSTPEEDSRPDGDVNNDGVVNTGDATAIFRHLLGTQTLDATALIYADYNGDGAVSTSDVRKILNDLVNA